MASEVAARLDDVCHCELHINTWSRHTVRSHLGLSEVTHLRIVPLSCHGQFDLETVEDGRKAAQVCHQTAK